MSICSSASASETSPPAPASLVTVSNEGVEASRDEVDRDDAVLGHVGLVLRVTATIEQAAVHLRVQGLDAPPEHLRAAGEL